jgi:hypothetical protein
MSQTWRVHDKNTASFFVTYINDQVEQGIDRVYTIQKMDRTYRQNNALHLLFRNMAKALNDAGFEISHPFKPDLEIPWSEESVKDLLYRPIITSYFKVERSSLLDTAQLSESMDILVDAVNRNTGVLVNIPSQESLYAPS